MKRIATTLSLIALTSLLSSQSARAAARTWNNTGTDFNAAASYTPATAPGTGDVALFSTAPVTQPNVTASLSIAGLLFGGVGTSGYSVNSANSSILTLTGVSTSGSSGTSNSSAAAIRAENTSGNNTINIGLILAPATGTQSTFVQASGGTLNVNGNISSAAGVNLSLRGGGTIYLGGNNSFATASIDTANETVILGTDTALGTGTFTVGATGTIQSLGARTIANSMVYAGNTTISGNSAFTINGTVTSSGSNSRTLTVSNTGGVTINGNVFLSDSDSSARSLTINGTSAVVINGVITNNNVGNTLASSLSYNGSGSLTLANTNTYGGGTFISGGAAFATKDGALGTGNVSLTGASVSLTLQGGLVNNYIADGATLNIQFTTDTVNLNFTGVDTIGSLIVNNTTFAPGTYGSATSGAANVLPEFTGSGMLLVAVPEPATYMLMGFGLLICAQQFRRKRV